MATDFEKTLREEVAKLAERLSITESKAFAVWYGLVALRLNEQEALEAASYDGGNDRGADFFFVDDEWERVIIAQWKYYKASNKTPSAAELTHLFNLPTELADAQDLRDDGREDLAEAAEALIEARDRGYALDLRFLYPGVKNKQRDREPERLVRAFNRKNRTEEITTQIVRLENLEVAYEDYKGSTSRVSVGELAVLGDGFLEEDGPYGKAFVATVPGTSLTALYEEYGNRLFDQNVRLFLGSRKGSVNAGIRDTLEEKDERGNFWAYNNGITVVARHVDSTDSGESLRLRDFSIVNGCQTTVSIAEASDAATKDVAVVARIIAADDPELIDRIIRFTNSQTPINVWDISARDKLQQQLRKEMDELDEPWFYALRRGDFDALKEKKRYGERGKRRVLAFPLGAQYLAALRGMPVEAYKEKALLFSTHKGQVFSPDTKAADLLWGWALGIATESAIPGVRKQLDGDEVGEAILNRGARFFVVSITAQLLRERNGNDFIARVGIENLFSKNMKSRLAKYAALATLYYVQIIRSLISSTGDIGTMIRRPETAEDIEIGVRERLIAERLAPEALDERLPKLPGIK
jgi:hypothetical protein